ncbi:folylpolyglutamate synthase/dihydrofolate synthase family protein [Rubellicoccus peritrichatus]|uniref:Dihydrofolate synthase/folylpolyglutamate synthase n=1 Tax=Rubellicoccus peritrichatus TaxID=3080537 RepID=A0AAQ3LBA0_9BACT|nr:folylpolyglutamate synthase/dihydrofolate synthase family protein [Puniceicoccus sp. CR14]WOO42561.1 folylpolyglutamate synthase/dihydrofolate synthase family protein [Puniceicoccus sp. CR14]
MTYAKTQKYLYGLKNQGSKYGIDRIRTFTDALGHPERGYPVIHVAGTNGKGSVCAMLEAIYRESGRKTGLFSSPHLVYLGERIQVDRQALPPEAITEYVKRLQPVAEKLGQEDPDEHPSFFEFMTAIAFLHFLDSQVDLAIIETGLGGRLDSTNVVEPEISIITSISLDHQQQLGDTIEAIAMEKAGIIKPGKPVITGWLPEAAERVIHAVAEERGCVVHAVKETFGDDLSKYPQPSLEGEFQRINAATAMLAVKVLQERFPVTQSAIASALVKVEWAGRWQKIYLDRGRLLILDATHNEEGARMLEGNLKRLVQETGKKPVVVTGTLGQSRAEAMMPVICEHASEIILLVPNQPRACTIEELRAAIPEGFKKPVLIGDIDELFPAPGVCSEGEEDDVIVVTGSIYLIGEICERLFTNTMSGEGMLQDLI